MKRAKVNIGAAHSRGNDVTMQDEVIKSMQGTPIVLYGGPSQSTLDRYKRINISKADQVDANIFIGNDEAALDIDWLKSKGITRIINCAMEIPNYHQPLIRYLRLDLADGQNEMAPVDDLYRVAEPAYRYIINTIKRDPNTKFLIHCKMGISRSASIVVYYLMRSKGLSYDRALEQLKGVRPIVSPNRWYERQLRDMGMEITKMKS